MTFQMDIQRKTIDLLFDLASQSKLSYKVIDRVTTIIDWVPSELLTTKTKAWHIRGQVKKYPVVATLLGHAIKHKNHVLAAMLVNRGVSLEHPVVFDWTPLLFACVQHDHDMVRLFLSKGSRINACEQRGNTSLHFVAQTGNLNLVQTLVRNGANAHICNKKGQVARDLAAQVKFTDIVVWLDSIDSSVSSLDSLPIATSKSMDTVFQTA